MICPHCKRENSNGMGEICAYCNQNMKEDTVKCKNLVAELNEAPISTPIQERPKKKKFPKIILVLLLIIIVGLTIVTVPTVINSVSEPITQSEAEKEAALFSQAKEKAISEIKSRLRNPESIQIHNVVYKNTPPEDDYNGVIDMDCTFIMKIDYSAQNGFGGMNRTTAYAKYYEDGKISVAVDSDRYYFDYSLAFSSYSYVEK